MVKRQSKKGLKKRTRKTKSKSRKSYRKSKRSMKKKSLQRRRKNSTKKPSRRKNKKSKKTRRSRKPKSKHTKSKSRKSQKGSGWFGNLLAKRNANKEVKRATQQQVAAKKADISATKSEIQSLKSQIKKQKPIVELKKTQLNAKIIAGQNCIQISKDLKRIKDEYADELQKLNENIKKLAQLEGQPIPTLEEPLKNIQTGIPVQQAVPVQQAIPVKQPEIVKQVQKKCEDHKSSFLCKENGCYWGNDAKCTSVPEAPPIPTQKGGRRRKTKKTKAKKNNKKRTNKRRKSKKKQKGGFGAQTGYLCSCDPNATGAQKCKGIGNKCRQIGNTHMCAGPVDASNINTLIKKGLQVSPKNCQSITIQQ